MNVRRCIGRNCCCVQPSRFFLLAIFLLNSVFAFSQTNDPIHISNADLLQYNEAGGIKIRKLIGHVQLQQNDVILFCDTANFYSEQNMVDAFGHVHIKQGDTLDIYSRFLHYDGNQRKAILNKEVRLTDGRMELTTEALEYDLNTRIASYQTGGTIISDTSVLTSHRGYYFANTGEIFFKKEVVLTHPDYVLYTDTLRFDLNSRTAWFVSPTQIVADSFQVYCEGGYYNTRSDIAQFEKNASFRHASQKLTADTIYYERLNGFGIGRNHIRWADTLSQIILTGNYAEYTERNQQVLATRQAMLTTILESDSLFLSADTLLSVTDSSEGKSFRKLFAFHHVNMLKSDMQGTCDSIAFSYLDSTFHLFRDPVLWVDDNQLSADTISVLLHNSKISEMRMVRNSFAVNEADSGLYNQVQGKNMTGIFEDEKLVRMKVDGNGESIYYAEDDSGALIGVNKAICSNMVLYFGEERKIDRIFFVTEPDATLYPLSQLPEEESRLKNFRWLADKKPSSKEEMVR